MRSSTVYLRPISCLACGQQYRPGAIEWQMGELAICHTCWQGLGWLQGPSCVHCGRAMEGDLSSARCGDCAVRRGSVLHGQRSLLTYNPLNRQLLYRYKYWGEVQLYTFFGQLMVLGFKRYYDASVKGKSWSLWKGWSRVFAKEATRPSIQLLTYVPLHESRLYERGFNQVELLGRILSKQLNLPMVTLLQRVKATVKQSKQGRGGRIQSLDGAFAPLPLPTQLLMGIEPDQPCQLLLLDDLYTTGSTLEHCAQVLQASYPQWQIYGLTLIRAGGQSPIKLMR
ncbi:ComF family protein [Rubeoparvulum massiliense]|uniref:ComF family protein n=1 Tax=Rubeoparvulum massiliense TaxID=1631346 RepID=UPI00065DE9D8|nr:double zinc ribbon domain-containing protein [Rubeoparvulum massiliense]